MVKVLIVITVKWQICDQSVPKSVDSSSSCIEA